MTTPSSSSPSSVRKLDSPTVKLTSSDSDSLGDPFRLGAAVTQLRAELDATVLGLEIDSAEAARGLVRGMLEQFDDYVLPRLRDVDAPLLAVVGGSTGAGKSTIVNSMVGRDVSPAGVLRPTTRSPVLVYAPEDAPWFGDDRILPGLARSHTTTPAKDGAELTTVQLTPERSLSPGLALLDAPDIDSVVRENRVLATELLAAADLWVFVTTAARYADAVPWQLLREAAQRSAAVAIVLNRVPAAAVTEVRDHFAQMLYANGLADSPLFVIAETDTIDGRLPTPAIVELQTWLWRLASDASQRAAVVRQTLSGVLDSLNDRVGTVITAVEDQHQAARELTDEVAAAYQQALDNVDVAIRDGSMLRGEVLTRWQEFVGTGDFLRSLETSLGRVRDRVVAAVRGRSRPQEQRLEQALESGIEVLLRDHADQAAASIAARWRSVPVGRVLLAESSTPLERSSPEFAGRISRLVRDWQTGVLAMVRREGKAKRSSARLLSYGINVAGLLVMVAVFSTTGGLTGAEVAVAGGTSVVAQKLLEALLGDQAVRELAEKARKDLRRRVQTLLEDEQRRFTDVIATTEVNPDQVRAALRAVQEAR